MFDDLSSVLGTVGNALDMPRKAVYGVGNAVYKGLTGDQGPDINNFGDILTRAGMDPDFTLTKALGFAGNVATDPLTYLGGAAALKGGKAISGLLGRGAAAAAPEAAEGGSALLSALGGAGEAAEGFTPFAGGAEKLSSLTAGMDPRNAGRVRRMLSSPASADLLGEIPEGSQMLGSGAEALTLRTPQGGVVRIAEPKMRGMNFQPAAARPNIPEVLQPTRSVVHGNYRVEHLPFVETGGEVPADIIQQLKQSIQGRGYDPRDIYADNIGRLGGNYVVLDGGAVSPLLQALGG